MSGVVETVEVDPTQAVGRLLPEGWRVERTYAYDGGTFLYGGEVWLGGYRVPSFVKRVPQGDTVTVVAEGDES